MNTAQKSTSSTKTSQLL